MKKKIFLVLIVFVVVFLGAGLFFFRKKDDTISEEAVQPSVDLVVEEVVQVPVDDAYIDLLEKMKIVKETKEFEGELLGNSCDKYQAYEMLNTMKGQDGAEVSSSYQGQQMTQSELLTLYLKELFQIDVKETEGESFEFYANKLELKDYFSHQEAAATNNNLISLAYACALYGLDDWENTKTVFQQMLESGYFNDTDISTFKIAAMDDIFNYGTNKCPFTEVYDEYTGRTYCFVDYFGNCYNSSTAKNAFAIGNSRTKKEILLRPYLAQQNMTADGTGFVFLRYPGCQAYLYDIETQTMKYIDTIKSTVENALYMFLAKSDTLYYIKDVDGVSGIYRKDLKSDSEPEKIVDCEGAYYIHVTNDEKYASVYSTAAKYQGPEGARPFIRIDIENKEVEVVQHHAFTMATKLPGGNEVNHIKINPVYPELYFFAHDYNGKYYMNCSDRVNIMNVDTDEIITVAPGVWEGEIRNGLTTYNICFTHESWGENGEYLYITNMCGDGGEDVPNRGMVRVNKDGTHRLYITNPEINVYQEDTGLFYASLHGAASGDDRYCVLDGYYITVISQETNEVFPIAYPYDPVNNRHQIDDGHPYHPHPTVSRGDTYVVNWGHYYVAPDQMDRKDPGSLGVAWFDFSDIDENEVAKGGEAAYNEYVSRLSYEGLDCESETGTFFEKDAIHAKAGNFATFNINTSIVDSINDTVTISFEYYDNGAQDMKLIYTKALEDVKDYCHIENGSADIICTNTGEWKKAEIVVHGDFETSGKYGTDFKIGSATDDVYITNIEVKKH